VARNETACAAIVTVRCYQRMTRRSKPADASAVNVTSFPARGVPWVTFRWSKGVRGA
jgi:hypothetical protein